MWKYIKRLNNTLHKFQNDWNTLICMVSKTETYTVVVYVKSIMIMLDVMLDYIIVNDKRVKTISKNLYQLEYKINNKSYKMLIKPHRGPKLVETITDDLGNNITDIVLEYMGPCFDWHGYDIKPSFFNVNELHIEFSNGTKEIMKNSIY